MQNDQNTKKVNAIYVDGNSSIQGNKSRSSKIIVFKLDIKQKSMNTVIDEKANGHNL
jgi:hypothetical protein